MSDSESSEFEAESVDEAIDMALVSLGAARADVDVEIIANPSRGLFGLGGRRARVKVTRRGSSDSLVTEQASFKDFATESRVGHDGSSDDLVEHGRDVLARLLELMGFASSVSLAMQESDTVLNIAGDNSSVLIGKHGQTLDALEYVLNRILSREEEAATRVHVDCEQYRVRRRHSLEQLAHKMAEEAKRRGRSVALEPLSPRDRRFIHLALQGDPKLTTRSSGEGFYRRVVIIPEGEHRRRQARR